MSNSRGTPTLGSRATHDVATDPTLHASDIEAGAPTVHNPTPGAAGTAPVSDGTKWVATDIVTQAELPHVILSATHTDATAAAAVRGDIIVGIGATPKWTRYALAVPGANLMNVLGVVNGETEPTWKALLDATNPETLTVSAAAAPGTATVAAHRDHVHPITSSSNPGAAASILATDASGFSTVVKLTATARVVTNAVGEDALLYNSGASCLGVGKDALIVNTGVYGTGMGQATLYYNSGDFCVGVGLGALYTNSGDYSNGFGLYALGYNSGYECSGFGLIALQYNTGNYSNAFGSNALERNVGGNAAAFGHYALRYNNWPYATAFGAQTSSYFLDNSATDQAFTDTEITANTITFTSAHGFGATGAKVNLRFTTTAGTPPTGLVSLEVYQFTITSPTVMTLAGIGTDASGDFAGKLTNSVDIHNSVAIGLDANATKAHQVMLGGADIVETYLRGSVGIAVTPTARLHLPAGSATASTAPLKFTSGTLLTTAEAGAVEFLTDDYWATITTGAERRKIGLIKTGAHLSMRPYIEQGSVAGAGKPTIVTRGVSKGYSLPLYAADEELFISEYIAGRWDGASDITVSVIGYLSSAETADDDFALQLSWWNAATNTGTWPDTTNDVTVVTNIPDARKAQYSIYKVDFTVDWDLPATDIAASDFFAARLRRVAVGGGNVEMDGEFVVTSITITYVVNKVYKD